MAHLSCSHLLRFRGATAPAEHLVHRSINDYVTVGRGLGHPATARARCCPRPLGPSFVANYPRLACVGRLFHESDNACQYYPTPCLPYDIVLFDLTDAEGEGCFTMTDLYGFQEMGSDGRSMGPVYVLDDDDEVDLYPDSFTGKWLLTSEMYITGGGEDRLCTVSPFVCCQNTAHPQMLDEVFGYRI